MMPQHHNTVTLELALTRRFPCFDILYYTSRVYCGSLLCHNCIVQIYGSMGHQPYIHHHFFHLIINQCTCLIFSCNEDANAVIIHHRSMVHSPNYVEWDTYASVFLMSADMLCCDTMQPMFAKHVHRQLNTHIHSLVT